MVRKKLKYIYLLIFLLNALFVNAQESVAVQASYYFERGDLEKAIPLYKQLMLENPNYGLYYNKLYTSYIKTKRYADAEVLVSGKINSNSYQPSYYVDMGYVYKVMGNAEKSNFYYESAINKIIEKPRLVHSVAINFENKQEPEFALKAYLVAESNNVNSTKYYMQKAKIYGELGRVDDMLGCYLGFVEDNKSRVNYLKRHLKMFMNQNNTEEMNLKVKNVLLFKIEETNKPVFSELLYWFYVEKEEYNNALNTAIDLYENHIFRINEIQIIGDNALQNKKYKVAESAYKYIRLQKINKQLYYKATQSYLELQSVSDYNLRHKALSKDDIVEEYINEISTNKIGENHFRLILSYAKYVSKFDLDKAILIINNKTTDYKNYERLEAEKQMLLGDVYLLQGKFTKAFVAFQKAETMASDSSFSDLAKLKSVKVSFYNGDFKWALAQAKVLKKSISRWYANDAVKLMLLLNESYNSDSSEVALKLYSKADIFEMQGNIDSSFAYHKELVKSFPNHHLVPYSIFAQAEIMANKMAFNSAISKYEFIYLNYPNNNLSELALFRISEVYLHNLNSKTKAKKWLKELIVKYPYGIYTDKARDMYKNIEKDRVEDGEKNSV